MRELTQFEALVQARGIVAYVAFFDDEAVIRACETIAQQVIGTEADAARHLSGEIEALADRPDGFDPARIRSALKLLDSAHADERFAHLKKLCLSNGLWTVPEDPATYSPVWYEIGLFGVAGFAEEAEMLPVNWCLAARRALISENGGNIQDVPS